VSLAPNGFDTRQTTVEALRQERHGWKGVLRFCALGCTLAWMDGDQVSVLSVFGPPPLAVDPEFDVRAFLDPWPPRRALNPLQRARIARGVTQEELAAELGVTRHTVSSMENRHRVPSVRLALAVAAALNGTVEELFAADELR